MEWTKEDRIAAVKALSSEWPYLDARELYEADGDSIENIAVFLQMQLLRAASPPEAAGRWIDCKQELPPLPAGSDFPSVRVLAAKPMSNGDWIIGECSYTAWLSAKRESARKPRFFACRRIYEGVTHWQPLPAPPSGEQAQPSVEVQDPKGEV